MKEETGLDILNPRLAGIKQFPIADGRYIVLLFKTDQFAGEVVSSEEGQMEWIDRHKLSEINAVDDLEELLKVIENPDSFSSVQSIYKWEAGQCYPQADNLLAMAKLYQVNPFDLIVERS